MTPYEHFFRDINSSFGVAKRDFATLLKYVSTNPDPFLQTFSANELLSCKDRLLPLLARLKSGEPLDYILGVKDFYGLKLKVNRDVLIPRQETELLMHEIIQKCQGREINNIFDICCGSGAMGLSLKKNFPKANVSLSDISEKALAVAKENAKINDLDVTFCQGDLLKPLVGKKADLIVCNPPYISIDEYDEVESSVKNFEPAIALVAEDNGLALYKRMAEMLPEVCHSKTFVAFEIGYKQKRPLEKIFLKHPFSNLEFKTDLSGLDRFFFLEIE